MIKQATASLIALGAATVGVDATVLNEVPVQAEYALKEHVSVVQRGDVVEATMPWKDQNGLRIKYDMGKPTAKEKRDDKRKRQVVVEQVSTDAMKIDIILNEKPTTNRFCYTIEGWEDYDFFYQPALTPEEIEQGSERPEEIVGSYAVYHKTLKNHEVGKTNYETGKVAHIPYPYIWSVNATSTKHRAEAFDITDGHMCVTVAQSDLDGMEYPIRLDPTFGYTSLGASDSGWWIRTASGFQRTFRIGRTFTPAGAGTVTEISVGARDTGGNDTITGMAFLNTEDAGANSHALIGASGDVDQSVTTTEAFENFSGLSIAVTAVPIVINASWDWADITATRDLNYRYDSGGASINGYTELFSGAGAYTASKENPWTQAEAASTLIFSIYATYEVASTPLIDSGAVIFE